MTDDRRQASGLRFHTIGIKMKDFLKPVARSLKPYNK